MRFFPQTPRTPLSPPPGPAACNGKGAARMRKGGQETLESGQEQKNTYEDYPLQGGRPCSTYTCGGRGPPLFLVVKQEWS